MILNKRCGCPSSGCWRHGRCDLCRPHHVSDGVGCFCTAPKEEQQERLQKFAGGGPDPDKAPPLTPNALALTKILSDAAQQAEDAQLSLNTLPRPLRQSHAGLVQAQAAINELLGAISAVDTALAFDMLLRADEEPPDSNKSILPLPEDIFARADAVTRQSAALKPLVRAAMEEAEGQ